MNIASTQFTLQHKAFEIYVSGCDGSCKGCHNPELQDFNIGTYYKEELPRIINKINKFELLVDNIWILGGEPLQQDLNELMDLILQLKAKTKCKIWLWTRFNIEHLPYFMKENCDYIKCGKYIDELKTENNVQYDIKLATSNQKIYKMEELHIEN